MSTVSHHSAQPAPGTVYLVGAGPGDPELITVRGLRCLRQADVLLYDRLVHPALLGEVPAAAEKIFVGKAPGRPGVGQAEIHRLLIEHAARGAIVVRLKGGDPFIFGRGSEEAADLQAAGIPWEVVPAISSAFGVPARAGIPLTHRRLARSFTVVTGHTVGQGDFNWSALAAAETLVVLMGVKALPTIVRRLALHGKSLSTPVAVIERGTMAEERVLTGTLATITEVAAGARSPAVIVIGEVVHVRENLLAAMPFAPLLENQAPSRFDSEKRP